MLTHFGRRHRTCDGIGRRDFLAAGLLSLGGLTLADVLRLRAASAPTAAQGKAVILVYLAGGPSHIDTYDMKPGAPAEIRGEFKSIQTNVPGVEFCELLPLQAKIADKLAVLRGVATVGYHTGNEFFSGFAWEGKPGDQLRPALGSIVSRLRGPNQPGLPGYVSLLNPNQSLSTRASTWEQAVYAGQAHQPFSGHSGDKVENQALNNLQLPGEVDRNRLESRKELLRSFDTLRERRDSIEALKGVDDVNAQALDLMTSNRVRDAFDVNKVGEKARARYFEASSPAPLKEHGKKFLQAFRLVQAGVPVVTLSMPGWDTHTANFKLLREQLPVLDRCLHALVSDLHEQGLANDVAVLVAGEMGRTPKLNNLRPDHGPGRDHWPAAGIALMAGGGLQTGQVVGATDGNGERPTGNAIRPQHLMSTLYHVLGIDPATTIPDHMGRPQYLLDEREAIKELV